MLCLLVRPGHLLLTEGLLAGLRHGCALGGGAAAPTQEKGDRAVAGAAMLSVLRHSFIYNINSIKKCKPIS